MGKKKYDFKYQEYKGFELRTYTFRNPPDPPKLDPLVIGQEKEGWGLLIPTGVTVLKQRKYFGWYILFMKKWVGFGVAKRILPVRQDKIVKFMFWYFVRPIHNLKPKSWITVHNTPGISSGKPI